MILELEFIFPSGRFHGEEWPPSPARVFQALVAGTHRGVHGLIHRERRDHALRWLEAQPPPAILAPAANRDADHLDNYVPNNDDGAGAGHVRTAKRLGAHSFVAGGVVAYRWTFEEGGEDADVVAAMASLVTYLGQAVDGVFCRGRVHTAALPDADAERTVYLPQAAPGGACLVPAPGFFDWCRDRYPRSVSSEPPDFTNSRQVDYLPVGLRTAAPAVPMEIFEIQRLDGGGPWWPEQVREPAGLVRGALADWARRDRIQRAFGADRVARLLTGHRAAGDAAPSGANGHFGVVPLPSLRHEGVSDGRFRRVALVGWGLQAPEDHELFREAARTLHGTELRDQRQGGTSPGALPPPGAILYRAGEASARHWRELWTRPAQEWRSVTPVVLTGRLRPGRTLASLVTRVLMQAGHAPEAVRSVATSAGPLVPGTRPAPAYRISQDDYLNQTLRCHVEVRFHQALPGPLVLGRGRYAGLGLCLPLVLAERR